ncbi:capsid protein [Chifec virus UA15_2320]|uniref:Capsid protein n=1 Tax=Chifec virus UA15_2320 TaxID=2914460 RepID=A0AAX3A7R6_9CIRC|nr:capsid protein [Chifec virus UA15_2320]UNY50609.1 capsid protein [Chifec virus UA15_2320]
MVRVRRSYRRKRYGVVRRKSRMSRRKRYAGRRRRRIARGLPRKSIVYRYVPYAKGTGGTPTCRLDTMGDTGGFHAFRSNLAKDINFSDVEKKMYTHFRVLKVYIKYIPEFKGTVSAMQMANAPDWILPTCYRATIVSSDLPSTQKDFLEQYKVKPFDPTKVQRFIFTPKFINPLLWNPKPMTAWLAISKMPSATLNAINTPCISWSPYKFMYNDVVKNTWTECSLEFRTVMSYKVELMRCTDLPGVQDSHSFNAAEHKTVHVHKNPNYKPE